MRCLSRSFSALIRVCIHFLHVVRQFPHRSSARIIHGHYANYLRPLRGFSAVDTRIICVDPRLIRAEPRNSAEKVKFSVSRTVHPFLSSINPINQSQLSDNLTCSTALMNPAPQSVLFNYTVKIQTLHPMLAQRSLSG